MRGTSEPDRTCVWYPRVFMYRGRMVDSQSLVKRPSRNRTLVLMGFYRPHDYSMGPMLWVTPLAHEELENEEFLSIVFGNPSIEIRELLNDDRGQEDLIGTHRWSLPLMRVRKRHINPWVRAYLNKHNECRRSRGLGLLQAANTRNRPSIGVTGTYEA